MTRRVIGSGVVELVEQMQWEGRTIACGRTGTGPPVDFGAQASAFAAVPSGSPFFRFAAEHPGVLDGLPPYVHEAVVRAYIAGASHRGLADDDLAALVAPWLGDVGQPALYRQMAQYDAPVALANLVRGWLTERTRA